MSGSIEELLNKNTIDVLYGNLKPIFRAIQSKKFKFDPHFYTHEVSKKDLAGIRCIKKFKAIPNERSCKFEAELHDGRLIEVNCKVNNEGIAIVAAKLL